MRLQAAILVSAVLAGCAGLPAPRPVSPALVADVDAYLSANDDAEANRILGLLIQRPVEELEAALAAPRVYPEFPGGMFPGQVLRIDGRAWRYGLYVPETYQPDRAYPLIVCLHGAGFSGDAYLERWQPRLGDDYLLACPSVDFGAWWTPEAETFVMTLIESLSRDYHVDRSRIYLSGMSNGAIGTYLIGLNHADRFAALMPMAGPLPGPLLTLLDNARWAPVYIIHGKKDQVIPVRYSQEVWAYLLEQGYSVEYREHDRSHPMAGGHFFPREELPSLVEWLSAQKRPGWPRTVTVVRDRDHPGRSYWIRIDAIDSGAGSFWESEHDPEETRRLKEGRYARIEAVAGLENQIDVTAENVRRYTVLLSRELVDFRRPVIIRTNGRVSFEGRVDPDPGVLLEEARRWPDPAQMVEAALEIVVEP